MTSTGYRRADVASLRALRAAKDRIDRDFRENIDIVTLADEAGYSREHFIRAFRAAYGQTPGRYRTRRRVERACELLRSVNLTVTEICHLVGFTSVGTFSTRFAESKGMSPTRYRAEAALRGGPAPIPGCFTLMWETGLPAASHGTSTPAPAAPDPGTTPTRHLSRSAREATPSSVGAMINGISIVSVWVLDQDSAKAFYTEKLGFTLTNDLTLENGMRWMTVRPPGSSGNPGQEFLLMDPAHSMLDAATAEQVRALVAKGALSPGVIATDDCRGDYDKLTARGVEFLQPPAERPYGVEALLRDDSGNWFSFTQRTS